jgi:hypothetical protein
MAVTSYKNPGTAASVDRDGKTAWTNPTNALTDNASYATFTAKSTYSDWLRLTNYGFTNVDIPDGSTIDGIELSVQRYNGGAATSCEDSAFYLRKTAGQVGSNYATATEWQRTTEQTVVYGGATDKWGTTWTQAEILSSDFGLDLSAYTTSTGWAYVDVIQIRVYYTEAAVSFIPRGSYYPHILAH